MSMAKIENFERRELSVGDAVIDGLFTGLLAGLGMAAVLVLAGWTGGEQPAEVLSRFAPNSLTRRFPASCFTWRCRASMAWSTG